MPKPTEDQKTEATGSEVEPTGEETTETAPEGEEVKTGEEPEAEKKTPLTAEQLEKELTRTRAEAANWRTKLRDAEKKLSEAKTAEEYEAAVTELREQVAAKDHEILVGAVAREFNLPPELSARLQGSTEEELKADAKALQKFAAPQKTVELRGGLDPTTDPDEDDNLNPRELAEKYSPRRNAGRNRIHQGLR